MKKRKKKKVSASESRRRREQMLDDHGLTGFSGESTSTDKRRILFTPIKNGNGFQINDL